MKDVIKKYDQFLVLIKKLDGSKELRRKSQFYKTISFPVLEITNQYLGSCRWVITRLQKMDSRHIDLISKGIIDGMNRRK